MRRCHGSNVEATAQMPSTLNAEDIAYWYLRLNGFLTLRNFLGSFLRAAAIASGMAPHPEAKGAFATWITDPERRTEENYAAFEEIIRGLRAVVAGSDKFEDKPRLLQIWLRHAPRTG